MTAQPEILEPTELQQLFRQTVMTFCRPRDIQLPASLLADELMTALRERGYVLGKVDHLGRLKLFGLMD